MRRSQTVRNHNRTPVATCSDDMGVLKERDETLEDVLRRQLLERDRENDKLHSQISQLQTQLAHRPPLEAVEVLKREYTNLEILLQGTQRENERCMAELERGKLREKMLEKELERVAGPNWQANLDITPTPAVGTRAGPGLISPTHTRSSSIPKGSSSETAEGPDKEATMAYIEQVRLLILGMEQRMQDREEKLSKTVEKAEAEGTRFEDARKQMLASAL